MIVLCACQKPLAWQQLPVPPETQAVYVIPEGEGAGRILVTRHKVLRKGSRTNVWEVLYDGSQNADSHPIRDSALWAHNRVCISTYDDAVGHEVKCYYPGNQSWEPVYRDREGAILSVGATPRFLYVATVGHELHRFDLSQHQHTFTQRLQDHGELISGESGVIFDSQNGNDRYYSDHASLDTGVPVEKSVHIGKNVQIGKGVVIGEDRAAPEYVAVPTPALPWAPRAQIINDEIDYHLAGPYLYARATFVSPVRDTALLRCILGAPTCVWEVVGGMAKMNMDWPLQIAQGKTLTAGLFGKNVIIWNTAEAQAAPLTDAYRPWRSIAWDSDTLLLGGAQGAVVVKPAPAGVEEVPETVSHSRVAPHRRLTAEGNTVMIVPKRTDMGGRYASLGERSIYHIYEFEPRAGEPEQKGAHAPGWHIDYSEDAIIGNFRSRLEAPTILGRVGLATPDLRDKDLTVLRYGDTLPLLPMDLRMVTDTGSRFFATDGKRLAWLDIGVSHHQWEVEHPDFAEWMNTKEEPYLHAIEEFERSLYAIVDGQLWLADPGTPHWWDPVTVEELEWGKRLERSITDVDAPVLQSWKEYLFFMRQGRMHCLGTPYTKLELKECHGQLPDDLLPLQMLTNERDAFIVYSDGRVYRSVRIQQPGTWERLKLQPFYSDDSERTPLVESVALAGERLVFLIDDQLHYVDTNTDAQ